MNQVSEEQFKLKKSMLNNVSGTKGDKLLIHSNKQDNKSREQNLKKQRERACRNRARKKVWVERVHAEIAELSPEVEILKQQVPVLERFAEWLQKQESNNCKQASL